VEPGQGGLVRAKRKQDDQKIKGNLLAVRIPRDLMSAIDDQVAAMRADAPWVQLTRSDAVRWLLNLALRSQARRKSA
jgi:hypothetical protein